MHTNSTGAPVEVGFQPYPPSILIITNDASLAASLRSMLEDNGCQVYHIDARVDYLCEVRSRHFDLVVIDIPSIKPNVVQLCATLVTDPEWAVVPKAVITPPEFNIEIIPDLISTTSPLYHFYLDSLVEIRLLQVIQQLQYLAYRYL